MVIFEREYLRAKLKVSANRAKYKKKRFFFGSVARKENTENSDIDIVVEVQKPSLQLMYELKEALKQLFNCEVDLVRFRDSLRPLFKSNIERDAIYV